MPSPSRKLPGCTPQKDTEMPTLPRCGAPCEWQHCRRVGRRTSESGWRRGGDVEVLGRFFPYLAQARLLTVAGQLASGMAADEKRTADYFRRAGHENEFLARDVLRSSCKLPDNFGGADGLGEPGGFFGADGT